LTLLKSWKEFEQLLPTIESENEVKATFQKRSFQSEHKVEHTLLEMELFENKKENRSINRY